MNNYRNVVWLFLVLVLFSSCEKKKESVQINMQNKTSWDDFQYPIVDFRIEEPEIQAKDFKLYVPDLEVLIKEKALSVSKLLYDSPDEVPPLDSIIYTVCKFEGLAGKGGEKPTVIFVFGSQYFATLVDSTLTKAQIREEIVGVMVHEMCHAYQLDCKYEGDGWSVIEGIADAVRFLEGYVDPARQKVGGSWSDGYKTTGFFMVWIMQNKDPDFLKKLNRSLGENFDWRWDENIQKIMGQSVESLWQEYQDDLTARQKAAPGTDQ